MSGMHEDLLPMRTKQLLLRLTNILFAIKTTP